MVSLVNGRPGATNFSYSPVLRDFTKATNIRLRFLRTNTLLGHLMGKALRDPTVTRRVSGRPGWAGGGRGVQGRARAAGPGRVLTAGCSTITASRTSASAAAASATATRTSVTPRTPQTPSGETRDFLPTPLSVGGEPGFHACLLLGPVATTRGLSFPECTPRWRGSALGPVASRGGLLSGP